MSDSYRVAIFFSRHWLNDEAARAWVKSQPSNTVVLLTDDLDRMNAVVLRQCKCEHLVCAVYMLPYRPMRGEDDWQAARALRAQAMADSADMIVDFGEVRGGPHRFEGRETYVIMEPQL